MNTIGEQLMHSRITAEKATARVLVSWLAVAVIVLVWQYGS